MDSHLSLEAWKAARRLSLIVLEKTDDHYHPKAKVLFDQLRRAAVSVALNIVEGYALQTAALFRRHIRIALGSAAETECVLELVANRRYLSKEISKQMLELTAQVLRLLFGLLRKIGN